jgi:hypothetical protein
MWRSVLLGVVLAGVLAGCSLGGGSGAGSDAVLGTLTEPGSVVAALEVAARIPGITVLGQATDAAGRTGTVVAFDSTYWGGPRSDQFLFDPTTDALLSEREVRPDSTPAERAWQPIPTAIVVDSITSTRPASK